MAHYATRRFSYWRQLGFLTAFIGAGLVIGGLVSFIPLLGKINIFGMKDLSATQVMDKLLKPENATALRWSQFISTLMIFFLPPIFYAWYCHRKPFVHLGFNLDLNAKQIGLVIIIMFASLPIVSALQEITEMLPWSKAALLRFKAAEDEYNRQVAVIARMDNFFDYIISIIMIGLLPAMFEETLFRGGVQNLFSRWFKMPVLAIIITSIIFSAVHGSYLGFLSRFALSFVLGWMYFRTGNIWLSITGHFVNNAVGVTALYLTKKPGQNIDPSKMEDHFPLLLALAALAVVIGLFFLFEKISTKEIKQPGDEVLIPGYNFSNNPFVNDIAAADKTLQP